MEAQLWLQSALECSRATTVETVVAPEYSEYHWLQEPGHVIHQLKLWGLQEAEVQYYTIDTVQRGSWYAHSECLLQTLLSSGKEEDRRFALSAIMKIRVQS